MGCQHVSELIGAAPLSTTTSIGIVTVFLVKVHESSQA